MVTKEAVMIFKTKGITFMNLFLIDYENVKNAGLTGIDKLSAEDRAVIFYSPNADTISFEMHRTLMQSSCSIEFFKIKRGGKNFLDFQLSTYLGYAMREGIYENAVIISRDQGFDSLTDFWETDFAETSTKLFRFMTIGAFTNYISGLAKSAELSGFAQASEKAAAVIAEYEAEAEEIPEPVPQSEAEVFAEEIASEVAKAVVTAAPKRSRHGKSQPKKAEKKPEKKAAEQESEEASAEEKVTFEEIISRYPAEKRSQLIDCLKGCQRRKDLYITLIKGFGKKKGCEFYRDLKGHFDDIKKLSEQAEA